MKQSDVLKIHIDNFNFSTGTKEEIDALTKEYRCALKKERGSK